MHPTARGAVRGRLLDHVVGNREHAWRYGEAERSGCLQVDDELELGRPRDRKVGRFLALEDAAGINTSLDDTGRSSSFRSSLDHPRPRSHDGSRLPVPRGAPPMSPVGRDECEQQVGVDQKCIDALLARLAKAVSMSRLLPTRSLPFAPHGRGSAACSSEDELTTEAGRLNQRAHQSGRRPGANSLQEPNPLAPNLLVHYA